MPSAQCRHFGQMQAIQQQQPANLREHKLECKSAVQISAAAGSIASAQEQHAHTPRDMDPEQGGATSTAAAQQHVKAATDSTTMNDNVEAEQACQRTGSEIITVQLAVSRMADMDALSCSSSPDSADSVQPLKPLTPAQSSEHSPGSSAGEQRATAASSAAAAGAAPSLSCEICNISATSLELLQQHLQGRRHLKVLAVQDPAADAGARYEHKQQMHPSGTGCIACGVFHEMLQHP